MNASAHFHKSKSAFTKNNMRASTGMHPKQHAFEQNRDDDSPGEGGLLSQPWPRPRRDRTRAPSRPSSPKAGSRSCPLEGFVEVEPTSLLRRPPIPTARLLASRGAFWLELCTADALGRRSGVTLSTSDPDCQRSSVFP